MSQTKQIKKIKQHGLQRRLAVSMAGARSGARLLSSHAGSAFSNPEKKAKTRRQAFEREAVAFAKSLGELKGAYVKIGQMMALYGEHLLPEEVTTALHSLDNQTASMEMSVIESAMKAELGNSFKYFNIETEPLAAASLSQVHRASHPKSKQELCLKVQYPGVANTIESDFKMVLQLLKISKWVRSMIDIEEWMSELKDMLTDEVDYKRELKMTRKVAGLVAGDNRYVVPKVYPRWSTARLLTMDYLPGHDVTHLSIRALSQQRRNQLAKAMLEIFFKEVFEWGIMQTDPNFGNYRIQLRTKADQPDKLILLDFGAVRKLPNDFVKALRRTILAAHKNDRPQVIAGAIALNCLHPEQSQAVKESFADFCVLLMEPFRRDKSGVPAIALNRQNQYRWHESKLLRRVAKLGAKSLALEGFSAPPKEFALIARKLTGVFTFVSTLRAEMSEHQIVDKYL